MAYEFEQTIGARNNNASAVLSSHDDGLKRTTQSYNTSGAWATCMLDENVAKTSGKWLFECVVRRGSDGELIVGLGNETGLPASGDSMTDTGHADNVGIYFGNRTLRYNGVAVVTDVTPALAAWDETVITFYIDVDTKKLWVATDGVVNGGGDPASGTTPTYTLTVTESHEPMVSVYNLASGLISLHDPGKTQYPADGFTPFGYVPATINLSNIRDYTNVLLSKALIAVVLDRATGDKLATVSTTLVGGAATLSFDAGVANDQDALVFLYTAAGELTANPVLATIGVV